MADLDRLRQLLLQREQQRLDALEQRLENRSRRVTELSEILPDSLHDLQHDKRLQDSLETPISRGLETTVRSQPQRFAAMFYPIMGPAIRRAVSEALKGLLDNINQSIEHSFSLRSWRWRLEAWRTGIPFAQIILKHTLAYSIEEVFLVQRESGVLVARAARETADVLDRDAVAAMLSAIQRFIQESFATEEDHPVRSIEVGVQTLWIVPGQYAVLVAVIEGTVPRAARGLLQERLEAIHSHSGDWLRHEGKRDDQTEQLELEEALSGCLLRKQLDPAELTAGQRRIKPIWVLLVLILAVLAWLGWRWWWLDHDRDQLLSALRVTPGWVILDDAIVSGQVRIRALRDPLAVTAQQLLAQQAIEPERVVFRLESYQSTEPALAIHRLANITALEYSQLQLSETVTDSGLTGFTVRGPVARSDWQRLQNLDATLGLELQQAPLLDISSLRLRLAAPDEVSLAWRGDVLELSGSVPSQWRDNLPERLREIGIAAQVEDLSVGLLERRISLWRQRWENHLLRFTADTRLTGESSQSIQLLAQESQALMELSGRRQLPARITLTGLTDGRFSAPRNVQLRSQRAEMVRRVLLDRGIPADSIHIINAVDGQGGNNVRAVLIQLSAAATQD